MSKYYKVIAIPDETRILINYGLNNALNKESIVGTEIFIIEKGIDLKDPDTREKIGEYNIIKEKLEITEVFETFSITRKKNKQTTSVLQRSISPMLLNKTLISYESLNVNPNDNLGMNLKNNEISVGDLVLIK